jgi:hypothetical protein
MVQGWRQVVGQLPSHLIKGDGFSVRLYSRYGVRYCERGRELTLATEHEDATDRYGRSLLVFPTFETQLFIPISLRWDNGEPISSVELEVVLQRISAVFERYKRPFRVIVGDEIYEKLAASDLKAGNGAEGPQGQR